MRRALLGLLVLAACGEDAERPPPPAPPALRWRTLRAFDLVLALPESWTLGQDHGARGKAFLGPREGRFRTAVVVNRKPYPEGAVAWRRLYVDKFDSPQQALVEVLDRGRATVAGAQAAFLVYRETTAPYVTMDFYFWRNGYGYILRCTATQATFAFKYRPVFEEIARRLRYAPA